MELQSVRHGVKVYQVDALSKKFLRKSCRVVPNSHGLREDVMQKK